MQSESQKLCRAVCLPREIREGLTVETVVNGNSNSTIERGVLPWLIVGLVGPVQEIFVQPWLLQLAQNKIFFPQCTIFQLICLHGPASWAGSRAGSPVSLYVSLCLPLFITLHLSCVTMALPFSTIVSNCKNEHANHLQNL